MSVIQSISVSPKNITLMVGQWNHDARVEIFPSNDACGEIEWYSDDTAIAGVHPTNGYICGNAPGTTRIHAFTTQGNALCDYITVTVIPVPVESICVNEGDITLQNGTYTLLTATTYPPNATNPEVEWNSVDDRIVYVDAATGFVLATRVGETKICAVSKQNNDVRGCCTVTVIPPIPVTGVQITSSAPKTMNVGDTAILEADVLPSNAANRTVRWSSSDPSVATVNAETGEVTALKGGEVAIFATAADNQLFDVCTITVNFCGGANYRDVTQHTLELEDDGYYVCSKCGYRIKSPALQDKEVLNKSDFLAIVSLYHEYVVVVEKYPIYAERLLAMIDAIRGLPENNHKYDYCDNTGKYFPEYDASFDSFRMYVNVSKGSCSGEWILLNSMFAIGGAVIPPPYSLMYSAISSALLQEHPGATGFSGTNILNAYVVDYLKEENLISKEIAGAISVLFALDNIFNGSSCTSECYNINIVMLSKSAPYDCYQIKYHFSNGVKSLGRYSEYTVDGLNTVEPNVDYIDHVNNREYRIQGEE